MIVTAAGPNMRTVLNQSARPGFQRYADRWGLDLRVVDLEADGLRASCTVCGLRRRELWVQDEQARPVMALLWWHPRVGEIAVRCFAFMLGQTPPEGGSLRTLREELPGVVIGSEPRCRG